MTTRTFWRVQYVARNGVGAVDEDFGRRDFDTEAEAREWLDSPTVRSTLDDIWRAEIRKHTETVEVVVSVPYAEES